MTGLIGGETQLMFILPVASAPHIRAGRLNALAIAAAHRSQLFPDVPTFEESGAHDFDVATWFGMMTMAGVPQSIIARLNEELNRILKIETVRTRLTALGLEPSGNSPTQFRDYIRNERQKWAKVIKEAGVTVE